MRCANVDEGGGLVELTQGFLLVLGLRSMDHRDGFFFLQNELS